MGEDSRAVARLLRMSPNTERKYRSALDREGLLRGSIDALPRLGWAGWGTRMDRLHDLQ